MNFCYCYFVNIWIEIKKKKIKSFLKKQKNELTSWWNKLTDAVVDNLSWPTSIRTLFFSGILVEYFVLIFEREILHNQLSFLHGHPISIPRKNSICHLKKKQKNKEQDRERKIAIQFDAILKALVRSNVVISIIIK